MGHSLYDDISGFADQHDIALPHDFVQGLAQQMQGWVMGSGGGGLDPSMHGWMMGDDLTSLGGDDFMGAFDDFMGLTPQQMAMQQMQNQRRMQQARGSYPNNPMAQQAMMMRMQQMRAQHAIRMRQLQQQYGGNCSINANQCGQNGLQSIGFGPQVVAPGAQVNIVQVPQQALQGKRLFIPEIIAQFFGIADIKIGNRSQLNAAGTLPALMFSEKAVDSIVKFDPAFVGNTVTLIVVNVDPLVVPHTFAAGLIGEACTQQYPNAGPVR